MNEHIAYALPHATRAMLSAMLEVTGDNRLPSQVIDVAVKAWLADTERARPGAAMAATRGYQWKSLFLPEGTMVRAR